MNPWRASPSRRARLVFAAWAGAVVVVSVQVVVLGNSNLDIFRDAFHDLVAGRELYALGGARDYFLYPPPFALLFAPFALLPVWLGLPLWTAANGAALYWGLGRVLDGEKLLVARTIVFLDAVGTMQNVQSNALVAGLMLVACGELDRRREARAALAVSLAAAVKVFPMLAALYALFRPYRLPRFAAFGIAAAALLIVAPMLLSGSAHLSGQYLAWLALAGAESLQRGYSVMHQMHLWLGWNGPNWPVQLAGLAVLVAPLVRLQFWGLARFRLLFLGSLLMYSVLFNHAAESPSFAIAVTGVALWFVHAPRTRVTWAVLGLVVVGTMLASTDAMPRIIQEQYFEPYRIKVLPVLLVWLLTQVELWRQSATAGSPARPAAPAAAAA